MQCSGSVSYRSVVTSADPEYRCTCILIVQLLVEKKAELLTEYYDPSSLLCSDEVSNYPYYLFLSLLNFWTSISSESGSGYGSRVLMTKN
jgi:hypothetical protein